MAHHLRCRMLGTLLAIALLIVLTGLVVLVGQARAGEPSPAPSPSVVRLEQRAEYSNTYLLSDGQHRCDSYEAPVNYKAADGTWQPIDTSLLPDGSLDAYSTTATPVEVTVADEAPGQKPITVSTGDWSVSMNLLGWAEDDKLVVDDAAVYTDVAPETDVAYTVMGDGLKEVISLASPAAPNVFSYRLTHVGLQLRQDAEGGWGLYQPGASKPVFVVGSMTTSDSSLDAADEPAWCTGASMSVTPGENASTITYTVPRSWMNDPARVYPLKIDPDLGAPVAQDNYLSQGLPTQAFGSDVDLLCGNMNSSAGKCRSLVQFPQVTTDIPVGSVVSNATFRLRQYWQPTTHSDGVYVSQLASGAWWTESSTYSGSNGRMATDYTWPVQTVSGTGVWMSISCSAVVNDWIVNHRSAGNNGFIVYEPDAAGSGYSRKFRAHEYTGTDYDPKLEVTYTTDQAAPTTTATGLQGSATAGWRTGSQSVTLSATDPSNGGNPGSGVAAIRYRVDGGALTTYGSAFSVSGPGQHTVTYYATDNVGNVEVTKTGYVNIDTAAPQSSSTGLQASNNTGWRTSPQGVGLSAVDPSPGCGVAAIYYKLDGGAQTAYTAPFVVGGVGQHPVEYWSVDNLGNAEAHQTQWVNICSGTPTVGAPNGGETLYIGSTGTISWAGPALTSGHYSVELVDTGGTATTVDGNVTPSGTGSESLTWPVAQAAGYGWKVRVTYYDALGFVAGSDTSVAGFAILPGAGPQHTTTDLGSWDGHSLACQLDDGKLTAGVTDLAIASLGPAAEVSRSYRSGAAAGRFAPGWFFSFDRKLDLSHIGDALSKATYVDADNVSHDFYRGDAGSAWTAPNGFFAALSQNGDGTWKLLSDDQSYLTFSMSGVLLAETAGNGLATTYTWGADSLAITAANGQQIAVGFSSGAVTGASYATADGTRTVAYSGAGANWTVSYNAADTGANGTARSIAYVYEGGALTQIAQLAWPQSGSSATLTVGYDETGRVTEVRYPDYDAATRPDARASVAYDSPTQATVKRYGTVAGVANQPMRQGVYTWTPASSAVPGLLTSVTEGTGGAATTTTYVYADDLQVKSAVTTSGGQPVASEQAAISDNVVSGTHNVSSTATDTGSSANQQTVGYTYDAMHRVTSAVTCSSYDDATGHATNALTLTVYSYDGYGNLSETRVEDPSNGNTVVADTLDTYDAQGHLTMEKKLVSGTPQSGTWTETDYSAFAPNGLPQTTVARSIKLSYGAAGQDLTETATYDAFGNLLAQSDWGGATTQTNVYDLAGRQLTSADASGVITHTTYDCLGNATETYKTASGTSMKADWSTSTYDAMGRLLTQTTKVSDGSGSPTTQNIATNSWDGSGDEVGSSDSTVGGPPEKWIYDPQGSVTQHWAIGVKDYTDAARSTRSAYEGAGRVTGRSDPGSSATPGSAGSTTTTYDQAGQVVVQTNPDGSSVTSSYDVAGNVTSANSTATGGDATPFGADDRKLSETTGPSGKLFTTTSAYDQRGLATSAQGSSPGQSPTTTTYNDLGWVLRTVDADGVTDLKTHDAHGNVVAETIGSQGASSSTYDASGRLLTVTDPNGDLLTNSYDAFGNLREEKHQDWSAALLKDVVTDHDSLGRPTSSGDSVSGVSHSWTYPQNTAAGVQETISYDGAPLTRTQLNRNGRGMETSRVTTVASGATLTRSVADDGAARDTADRWTQASLQLSGYGAQSLARGFDNAGHIVSQSGAGFTSGNSASYTYSPTRGLKTAASLPLALGGAISDTYAYAADGRLSSWNGVTYGYDAAGNLIGDGTTFTYDAASNRLTSSLAGGVTTEYGWDAANAWRTSQGPAANPTQVQYTYVKSGASTSNGRMTRYQNSATSTDASYAYDAAGQRLKSTVTVSGTTTRTDFSYDGLTLLKLAATQGESSWRLDYLYDEDGTPYGGVYRSPASSSSPTCFTVITNDHGDVLELLDASGAAFASYRYDPWGSPLSAGTTTSATGLVSATLAGQIAARQVLRYASYAYDSESGLYYCSARYYDPATRQWTSGDPAKADGEESAYQYCGGEPVGAVDSSGAQSMALFSRYPLNGRAYNWMSTTWTFLPLPSVGDAASDNYAVILKSVAVKNNMGRAVYVRCRARLKVVTWNLLIKLYAWGTKEMDVSVPAWGSRSIPLAWESHDLVGTRIRHDGWRQSNVSTLEGSATGWFNLFGQSAP